jgi:hypothetical protein
MVYDMIYQNVECPLFYQDQHQLDDTYYLVMMPSMENGPGRHKNNTMDNKVHKTEQYNGNAFRNVYVPLVVSTSQSFPHS